MVCSPAGSSVHGIIQARILEWVGLPFPRLGDRPNPGIEPASPALQADYLPSKPLGKPIYIYIGYIYIYMYIYIYIFFFRFFSFIGYYEILNIVPCAVQ